jgi:hypothetical protein
VSRGEQGALPPPEPWGREVTRLTRSIDSMRRQLEGRPSRVASDRDLDRRKRRLRRRGFPALSRGGKPGDRRGGQQGRRAR